MDLFRKTFPHLKAIPERPGAPWAALAKLPVRRVPVVSERFTTNKPQNQISFLMQASGDLLSEQERCSKCAGGCGIYQGSCVVVRDPQILEWTWRGLRRLLVQSQRVSVPSAETRSRQE